MWQKLGLEIETMVDVMSDYRQLGAVEEYYCQGVRVAVVAGKLPNVEWSWINAAGKLHSGVEQLQCNAQSGSGWEQLDGSECPHSSCNNYLREQQLSKQLNQMGLEYSGLLRQA